MKKIVRHQGAENIDFRDYADQRFAISPWRKFKISNVEAKQIATLAARIRNDNPKLDRTAILGANVVKGCGGGPAIIFGDSSEIPLVGLEIGHLLEYRMGYLASDGDIMMLVGRTCPSFEAYQKRVLGLDSFEYVALGKSLVKSAPGFCLRDKTTFGKLAKFVSENSGVTIISFLTTSATWALASRLANETECPVHVAGPPGILSDCANDKLWFAKVIENLLGFNAMPPKRTAHGAAALVRHVMELARKWPKLVLKVPNSAGSAGNYVVYTKDVKGKSVKEVHHYLHSHLQHLGWPGRFPLAVEVWDTNVVTSPSAQFWIPDMGNGEPVLEGVFDQVLVGEEGSFAGAIPASLPIGIDELFCAQAFKLATFFQQLGYYGRCSFDAVLAGSDLENSQIHWIECNARWGGVSIPMTFAKRADIGPNFAVVQSEGLENEPRRFEDALIEFKGDALSPDHKRGIVFLNPNAIEAGIGCQILAVAPTQNEALKLSRDVSDRLRSPPATMT